LHLLRGSLGFRAWASWHVSSEPVATGWRRHLDGWPIGMWVVSVCVLTALLVVPRSVRPGLVPPPVIDRLAQRREQALEADRAERARAGLPLEVRSVGEAFRRYGRAAFAEPELVPQRARQLQRLASEAAARAGVDRLLELRALQEELLADALRGRPAQPPPDAVELAGGLLAAGLARGWFAVPPDGVDEAELGTLFRQYWANALGLGARHPFAPSLNEWRVYYRFMLGRPIPEPPERDGDLQRRLGYVAALSQHDQTYPAALARGILLYERGALAESAAELRAHLERSPDGPWSLRARNHLAACSALLTE
jgi:hypothetical protein